MTNKVRLPKQWRHWCADQKLKIHGKKRVRFAERAHGIKGGQHGNE